MGFQLILDGTNTNKPHGTIVYAKNKVMDELRQNIKNEDGFKRVMDTVSIPYLHSDIKLVGEISTPDALILFLEGKNGTASVSTIVSLNVDKNNNYTTSVIATTYVALGNGHKGFNFNVDNPIQGTFTYNAKEELIISWIEGIKPTANVLRVMNTVDLPFPVGPGNLVYNNAAVDIINSNRPLKIPHIALDSVSDSGGSLFNGVYSIYVAYTDNANNRTNFIASMNPLTIYYQGSGGAYNDVYDAAINTITGKAIHLDITDLSDKYTKIVVGVVYRTNGNETAFIKEFNYSGTTSHVSIRNLNDMFKTSVDDVIVDNIIYKQVNAITKFENKLEIGNLTVEDRNTELQQLALDIKVTYKSEIVKTVLDTPSDIVGSYKDNQMIINHRTFQPDEVYALYFEPLYTDGSKGEVYHIPGRAPLSRGYKMADNKIANETAEIVNTGGTAALPSKVDSNYYGFFTEAYDIQPNSKVFQMRNTADDNGVGELAYWENSNEVYPDEPMFVSTAGVDYRNQPVRHHKMPDETKLEKTSDDPNKIITRRIELVVSNINIPSSLKSKIQGYKILIAKRNGNNNLIVDEAFINNMIVNPSETVRVPIAATGLPYNQSSGINYTTTTGIIADNTYKCGKDFTVIPPSTLKYNNPLNYTYFKLQKILGLTLEKKNVVVNGNNALLDAHLFRPSTSSKVTSIPLDTQVKDFTHESKFDIFSKYNDNLFKVDKTFYCKNDGLYQDGVNFGNCTEAIYVKTDKSIKLINTAQDAASKEVFPFASSTDYKGFVTPTNDITYGKVTLCRYSEDVYDSFADQAIASVIEINDNNLTTCTISGDSYLSGVAIRVVGANTQTVLMMPYYSATNFELRTPGDKVEVIKGSQPQPVEDNYFAQDGLNYKDLDRTWGYSLLDVPYFSSSYKWLSRNPFINEYWGTGERSIKTDWAHLNDDKVGIIYNHLNTFLTRFPYRIASSLPQTTESLSNSWLMFKPADYQEMDNSKGQIQTLDILDKHLYIRQEFSLFVYTIKDSLEALGQSISLESNDIFHNRSEEIISDSVGYIGSNSRFNSLVTPFGYYILDVVKKDGFKVIGLKAEPLLQGVNRYFEMRFDSNFTNPYKEGDSILGFNDEDKSVLVSLNYGTTPFTLAFDIYNQAFLSFHDYVPTMYGRTRQNLLSFKKEIANEYSFGVYKHNEKGTKCLYYYDSSNHREPQEDIIDTLYNQMTVNGKQGGNNQNKQVNFAAWNTTTKLIDYITKEVTDSEKTIDAILVYTDTQATLIHATDILNVDWYETEYGRNIQDVWAFNEILDYVDNPRDIIIDKDFKLNTNNVSSKDYYDLSNFISTFAVLRLIHKNTFVQGTAQYEQVINMMDINFTTDNR